MSRPTLVCTGTILLALTALPTLAGAQASLAGPTFEAAHPRALVARPLLLPRGLAESAVALTVNVIQFDDVDDPEDVHVAASPQLRWGLGRVELAAALDVHVLGSDDWPSYAARVGARVAPIPDLAVGVALEVRDHSTGGWPSVAVAHKRRLGDAVALTIGGDLRGLVDDGELRQRSAAGELGAQVQVGPFTALGATAQLRRYGAVVDGGDASTSRRYAAYLLTAVAPAVDVVARLDHIPGDFVDVTIVTLAVAVRHRP